MIIIDEPLKGDVTVPDEVKEVLNARLNHVTDEEKKALLEVLDNVEPLVLTSNPPKRAVRIMISEKIYYTIRKLLK